MLYLKVHRLKGVKLVIGDRCLGLPEAFGGVLPRDGLSTPHGAFLSQVWSLLPSGMVKALTAMLSEDQAAGEKKSKQVVTKLREMRLPAAAALIENSIHKTLSHYAFPREHHR